MTIPERIAMAMFWLVPVGLVCMGEVAIGLWLLAGMVVAEVLVRVAIQKHRAAGGNEDDDET